MPAKETAEAEAKVILASQSTKKEKGEQLQKESQRFGGGNSPPSVI
jgi:hypothetical protein